ncbi:MAG: diaminopimelate decarboxylase family protein [Thermodesulfobacteriota bacterium]
MDISLWGLDINHKDHLVFGGCDVVELAKNYRTPLYIVDASRLRCNYRRFLNAFKNSYAKVKVFYSYKTNCVPGVIKILQEEGCGAEISSPYELWLASHLGMESSEVIYNGVNKSIEDLKIAIQKNLGLINVDSVSEIHRLKKASEELKREVNVGIRIYPEVGWKAQFGLQPKEDRVITIFEELNKMSFLNLCCLHVHIGTGIRDTKDYKRAIEIICLLIKELKEKLDVDIEYFDLGGGFGVPTVKTLTVREVALYKIFNMPPREPNVTNCPSVEVFGQVITAFLRRCCTRYGLKEPYLLLEPGRAITSDAQILLITVNEIKKRSNGTKFAITDGGMQNIAFPLSYEYHKCFLANRASAGYKDRYFVTGTLCSPEDLLYRNWELPELEEGDTLAIMDAGAYFTSFSNNFSYPRPAVVLVSDGCHELVRQQESFEHMTAMDKI